MGACSLSILMVVFLFRNAQWIYFQASSEILHSPTDAHQNGFKCFPQNLEGKELSFAVQILFRTTLSNDRSTVY